MNKPRSSPWYAGRRLALWCTLPLLLLLSCVPPSVAQASAPLRVVMVCSGSHNDFYNILYHIAHELHKLGITRHTPPYTMSSRDVASLWQWLSAHAGGTRLTFLPDGFYSMEWNSEKRLPVQESLRHRLAHTRDVDIILAFGTWAGLDMRALDTTVPVIACGVTDAISAGIIPSAEDSGKDNLVAVVEPDRFQRQIELFHQVFDFQRLGIMYGVKPIDRSIAAIDQIEEACIEHGVELVRCTGNIFHNSNTAQIAEKMEFCHKEFVKQRVDAVYITYNSLKPEQLRHVLKPLILANIPTLSQLGTREVELGVLASITDYSAGEGRFVAQLLRRLLAGERPRRLPQRLHSSIMLAINLLTAARIGWNPDWDVLLSVDKFYE